MADARDVPARSLRRFLAPDPGTRVVSAREPGVLIGARRRLMFLSRLERSKFPEVTANVQEY